jgi:hypothetical protein
VIELITYMYTVHSKARLVNTRGSLAAATRVMIKQPQFYDFVCCSISR